MKVLELQSELKEQQNRNTFGLKDLFQVWLIPSSCLHLVILVRFHSLNEFDPEPIQSIKILQNQRAYVKKFVTIW